MAPFFQRRVLNKGLLIVAGFLTVAGFAFWLGSAPPTEDTPYTTEYRTDPGDITVLGISEDEILPQKFQFVGEADGQWYFDGAFPLRVESSDGKVLWEDVAVITSGDYMRGGMFPYIAAVDVGDYEGKGVIILKRNNPSEDPAYDKEYRIAVTFTDSSASSE